MPGPLLYVVDSIGSVNAPTEGATNRSTRMTNPPPPSRDSPQQEDPRAPHPQAGHVPGQPPYGPPPGQPPHGRRPNAPGEPPRKQGMSTGTKISIGAGAAALVLALVIGAIIVLPTGDDEDAASASLGTSETTAPEDESSETVEDEGDDNPFGGPADDPETQVYTGSGDEIIELDEPHSDPRIATIEGDDYTHVNLRDRNGDPSGAMGSAAEGFDRRLYHFHPRYEEETTQLEVLSTATSWTITLEPLSTAVSWTDPDQPVEGVSSEIFLLDWEVANRELTIEHTGDRYFVVWVFDLESGLYDTIADEVGDYESTDPLPPNTSIIQVNAIGEWSLT